MCTAATTICQSNSCVSCGGPGQPCCAGSTCGNAGLICDGNNKCASCGAADQACCAGNICGSGANCVAGTGCVRCGSGGEACCVVGSDNDCGPFGGCATLGGQNRCYTGSTGQAGGACSGDAGVCPDGTVCSPADHYCITCGHLGEPCCSGNACSGSFNCSSGRCR